MQNRDDLDLRSTCVVGPPVQYHGVQGVGAAGRADDCSSRGIWLVDLTDGGGYASPCVVCCRSGSRGGGCMIMRSIKVRDTRNDGQLLQVVLCLVEIDLSGAEADASQEEHERWLLLIFRPLYTLFMSLIPLSWAFLALSWASCILIRSRIPEPVALHQTSPPQRITRSATAPGESNAGLMSR